MPKFSAKSRERLDTCHPLLVRLMNSAITDYDFTVLCGHRGQVEQDKAFAAGNSKLKFPKSKHNVTPSMAVDIAPYPVDWNDLHRFDKLSEVVRRHWEAMPVKERQGYELVWGGGWASFPDRPHYELRSTRTTTG
jgi:peptidoglycan L-alanyl-D-glutamate endopeptidase CwlK